MKEPKIMSMDWRSLGYWPVWKDGKKVWVPKDDKSFDKDTENQDMAITMDRKYIWRVCWQSHC